MTRTYPYGTVGDAIREGFKTFYVRCCNVQARCHHEVKVDLAALPDRPWKDLVPTFRCEKCGDRGRAAVQPNWADVIDFSKPSSEQR